MPVTVTTAQGFTRSTKFQTFVSRTVHCSSSLNQIPEFLIGPGLNWYWKVHSLMPNTRNVEFLFTLNPKAPLTFHWLKQHHPSWLHLSQYHKCRLYTKHRGTQPLQLSKSNMHSCSSMGYLERSMSQATVEVILFGATWTSVSYIQTEPFPQNSKDWVENFETLILTKGTVFKVLMVLPESVGNPKAEEIEERSNDLSNVRGFCSYWWW